MYRRRLRHSCADGDMVSSTDCGVEGSGHARLGILISVRLPHNKTTSKSLFLLLLLISSYTQSGAFTEYLIPFLIEQTLYHDFVSVHIYCVPLLFTLRRHQDPMHGTMEQKILDSSPPTERPRK